MTVICGYFRGTRKTVKLTVTYALPDGDFNPFADFDVGCTINDFKARLGNGAFGWSAKDRLYRVVSKISWSYATLLDPYHQLAKRDVSPFEAIARTLLKRSEPAAHTCTLPGSGGPTFPARTWTFLLRVNASSNASGLSGGVTGSFVSNPTATDSVGAMSDLSVDHDLVLSSGSTSIDLRFDKVLDFSLSSAVWTLRFAIEVVSSSYPSCDAGATGTLTAFASTSPNISVAICGSDLVQGSAVAGGKFVSIKSG